MGVYSVRDAGRAGIRRHGGVGVHLGPWMGVFDSAGALLVGGEGVLLAAIVPGRDEAALLRVALDKRAKTKGTSRADYRWSFERYALPGGKRLRATAIDAEHTGGWPFSLAFPKKDRGRVAKIICGDEDHPYTLSIEMGDDVDRVVGPPRKPLSRHPRACGRAESIDAKSLALLLADANEKVRAAARHLKAYGKGGPPT